MNRCFYFDKQPRTWFEARHFCQRFNGDLATVNSIDSMKAISELIVSGGQYWVGLHRISWKDKTGEGTLISNHSLFDL